MCEESYRRISGNQVLPHPTAHIRSPLRRRIEPRPRITTRRRSLGPRRDFLVGTGKRIARPRLSETAERLEARERIAHGEDLVF